MDATRPTKHYPQGGGVGLLNLKEIIHFNDFKRKCVENLLTQQSSHQKAVKKLAPHLLHSVRKMRFYPPPQKKDIFQAPPVCVPIPPPPQFQNHEGAQNRERVV